MTEARGASPPLHADAGPGALRFVRTIVFGLWAVIVADTSLHAWADLPAWMFNPPGILRPISPEVWSALIDPTVLIVFRVALLLGLIWATVSRRPSRFLLIPVALGIVLFHGFILGWGGFLNHARMGPMYVALLLAAMDHRTPEDRPERIGAGLFLTALVLSIPYFLIGFHRFLVGGLEVFTGDALPLYMLLRTLEPGSYTFQTSYWLLQYTWILPFLKAGFFLTTVAEVLSPVALFHRRLRLAWLAVIVPFHVATLFTMNIFFWENLILIALLFTNLPTRAESWWKARR